MTCPCCNGARTVPHGAHHWRPEDPEPFVFVATGTTPCPGCCYELDAVLQTQKTPPTPA